MALRKASLINCRTIGLKSNIARSNWIPRPMARYWPQADLNETIGLEEVRTIGMESVSRSSIGPNAHRSTVRRSITFTESVDAQLTFAIRLVRPLAILTLAGAAGSLALGAANRLAAEIVAAEINLKFDPHR